MVVKQVFSSIFFLNRLHHIVQSANRKDMDLLMAALKRLPNPNQWPIDWLSQPD